MRKIFCTFLLLACASAVSAETVFTTNPNGTRFGSYRPNYNNYENIYNNDYQRAWTRHNSGRNSLRNYRRNPRGNSIVFDNAGNKVGTVRPLSNGNAYSYTNQYGSENAGVFKTFPSGRGVLMDNSGRIRGAAPFRRF